MDAKLLLHECHRRGIVLAERDGLLRVVEGEAELTPDLDSMLDRHQVALLALIGPSGIPSNPAAAPSPPGPQASPPVSPQNSERGLGMWTRSGDATSGRVGRIDHLHSETIKSSPLSPPKSQHTSPAHKDRVVGGSRAPKGRDNDDPDIGRCVSPILVDYVDYPPPEHPRPLPWRSTVGSWPIDLRQRWGDRANALQDGGLPWHEAERVAFEEVSAGITITNDERSARSWG